MDESRYCKFCDVLLDNKTDDALPQEFRGTCSKYCWSYYQQGHTHFKWKLDQLMNKSKPCKLCTTNIDKLPLLLPLIIILLIIVLYIIHKLTGII